MVMSTSDWLLEDENFERVLKATPLLLFYRDTLFVFLSLGLVEFLP